MWWQGASQMTDADIPLCSMSSTSTSSISSASASTSSDWWCGGSGQVKWLTDVVARGKSNDWLMWWYGNALCLVLVLALSLVLVLSLALTDDVVAGGKSNDWLMWWQGASQMTDADIPLCSMSSTSTSSISSASASASSDWWCGGSGQVKWLPDVVAGDKSNDWLMQWYGNALCLALVLALTDDVVAVGKSNDWLMWRQWASQMTDWCSGTVMLYV